MWHVPFIFSAMANQPATARAITKASLQCSWKIQTAPGGCDVGDANSRMCICQWQLESGYWAIRRVENGHNIQRSEMRNAKFLTWAISTIGVGSTLHTSTKRQVASCFDVAIVVVVFL